MDIVSTEPGDVPSKPVPSKPVPGKVVAGNVNSQKAARAAPPLDRPAALPVAAELPVLADRSSPQQGTESVVSWQESMRRAIRSRDALLLAVNLSPSDFDVDCEPPDFPVFVPREFVARIELGNANDPLLRQVLPTGAERHFHAGFGPDPVGDHAARRQGDLLQKYAHRALWVTTGVCPVHCRYCFRQHFDYGGGEPVVSTGEAADQALSRNLTSHKELSPFEEVAKIASPYDRTEETLNGLRMSADLEEVILSGGDPLTWSDDRLRRLVHRMASIPHIERLRIHSRMPVMIPQRITNSLVELLRNTRLTVFLVVHINHPAEIDASVVDALARCVDGGIPVLNQSVLLAGVNDDLEVLVSLCRKLVNLRVMPYYLHQLDRVQGAAHFEVPVERGRQLIDGLRRELPGYAVPKYVSELPGQPFKTPLGGR